MIKLDEDAMVVTVVRAQFKSSTSKGAVIKSDCHKQEKPSVALCLAFRRYKSFSLCALMQDQALMEGVGGVCNFNSILLSVTVSKLSDFTSMSPALRIK